MDSFRLFLEAMIGDGVLERTSDAGVARLLSIYTSNDLQPPVDLIASAEARGLIQKV